VLGLSLDKNGITLDEGLAGKVERESQLPVIVGNQPAPPAPANK